jgi:hypothetical protein
LQPSVGHYKKLTRRGGLNGLAIPIKRTDQPVLNLLTSVAVVGPGSSIDLVDQFLGGSALRLHLLLVIYRGVHGSLLAKIIE